MSEATRTAVDWQKIIRRQMDWHVCDFDSILGRPTGQWHLFDPQGRDGIWTAYLDKVSDDLLPGGGT